jgi:D-galacturonate reductase
VKTIKEHRAIIEAARSANVLVAMEVHKRWDPMYLDARDRIRQLGEFSYFSSYMSQPKSQLDTFRAWAGLSSDISYYLNAHHIDFNLWAVGEQSRPQTVVAAASTGYASSQSLETEDSITLTVQWENRADKHTATAVYTAGWIAPKSDVHSQQRFFYVGRRGEIRIDQAHRGYSLATDDEGFSSPNPLFMKYTPDADGFFSGQTGYGYRSLEAFVEAAASIHRQETTTADYRGRLATAEDTVPVTAILEAGRRSLDEQQRVYQIEYDQAGQVCGLIGR